MTEDSAHSSSYCPLSEERSIRLLRITDTHPSDGSSLACALDTVHLDGGCPEYAALSYTWGSPVSGASFEKRYDEHPGMMISVRHDGGPPVKQRILKNLFDALLAVHEGSWKHFDWSPGKPYQDARWIPEPQNQWRGHLWADAICINQGDMNERSAQVQLMKEIYSRCSCVIAWVGPTCLDPTCTSRGQECPVWDCTRWFYGPFSAYLTEWLASHGGQYPVPTHQGWDRQLLIDKCGSGAMTDSRLAGTTYFRLPGTEMTFMCICLSRLAGFISRVRFFRRAWILQEMALANKIVLLAGDFVLPEDSHLNITSWLYHNWDTFKVHLENLTNRPMLRPALGVLRSASLCRELVSRPSSGLGTPAEAQALEVWGARTPKARKLVWMAMLLSIKSSLKSTQAVDEVYSVLGLVDWVEPSVCVPLDVDYSLHTIEVYRRLAVELLTETPYLTAFSLLPNHSKRKLKGLPSWVPDWAATTTLPPAGGLQVHRFPFEDGRVPFDACPTRTTVTKAVEIEGQTLRLYGRRCGTIRERRNGNTWTNARPGCPCPMRVCARYRPVGAIVDFILWATKQIDSEYSLTGQSTLEAIGSIGSASCQADEAFRQLTTSALRVWLTRARVCMYLHPPRRDKDAGQQKRSVAAKAGANRQKLDAAPNANADQEEVGVATNTNGDQEDVAVAPNADVEGQNLGLKPNHSSSKLAEDISLIWSIPGSDLAPLSDLIKPAGIAALIPRLQSLAEEGSAPDYPGVPACHSRFTLALKTRCMFLGDDDTLGLCPIASRRGDELWVLCAGRIPQVLRPLPEKGKYKIIGEAYIHGGMDGELLEKGLAGPLQQISIV